MDRWTMMVVRAYWPAVGAMGLSFVMLAIAARLARSEYIDGLAGPVGMASGVVMAAGAGWWLWITLRVVRAHYGKGLVCSCGGLLGRERPGTWGQTDYRRCLACNDAVSSRDYR